MWRYPSKCMTKNKQRFLTVENKRDEGKMHLKMHLILSIDATYANAKERSTGVPPVKASTGKMPVLLSGDTITKF
jgi:hypothetical protein